MCCLSSFTYAYCVVSACFSEGWEESELVVVLLQAPGMNHGTASPVCLSRAHLARPIWARVMARVGARARTFGFGLRFALGFKFGLGSEPGNDDSGFGFGFGFGLGAGLVSDLCLRSG